MKLLKKIPVRVWHTVLWTLVLAVALSMIFLQVRRELVRREFYVMNGIYHDLTQARWALAEPNRDNLMAEVWFGLENTAEELEHGSQLVSRSLPAAAAWWFEETAWVVRQMAWKEELSQQDLDYLAQLDRDLETILNPMTGPDGMNLDPELGIDRFSEIILRFYEEKGR